MSPERYLRTFDVLDLLVKQKNGLRLTEIKEALGLPVSSVHNMLQTMVSADIASVDEELRYTVGPRAVGLALRKPIKALLFAHAQSLGLGVLNEGKGLPA